MFDVVLWRPEIPPNTGNLMRLTVNTGCRLHLIEPLGFDIDDARLRRAGLDYREFADVATYSSYGEYVEIARPERLFAFTHLADRLYTEVAYKPGDVLLFGRESDGLPEEILESDAVTDRVRIPIAEGGRSLNLANAAAIAVYEAWRQNGFADT
ncbi:MAG: tRNA (cytidine(34)-2'-O)-methyltransferase [Actinomycetota bacterium]|nr:tRNA (cytidine(34)-2'-O)-methyltransferase [Actinomycetota bacterium]MDK1292340.1 tRNA (cytidine(34)-2'-O)-methyltransferase [Actinomycetota bacterium]